MIRSRRGPVNRSRRSLVLSVVPRERRHGACGSTRPAGRSSRPLAIAARPADRDGRPRPRRVGGRRCRRAGADRPAGPGAWPGPAPPARPGQPGDAGPGRPGLRRSPPWSPTLVRGRRAAAGAGPARRVALALDGVDGQVARRTGTVVGVRRALRHGGRRVPDPGAQRATSPAVGAWVLAIGLARYLLLAAGRVLPWLRRPVPPRYWGKVVAAVQGIVLTVAASRTCCPRALADAGAAGGAGPAGRVVRPRGRGGCGARAARRSRPTRSARRAAGRSGTCVALAVVWARAGRARTAWPGDRTRRARSGIPLEALRARRRWLLVLPARARRGCWPRWSAWLLALLTLLAAARHGLLRVAQPAVRPGHRLALRRLGGRPARATRSAAAPRTSSLVGGGCSSLVALAGADAARAAAAHRGWSARHRVRRRGSSSPLGVVWVLSAVVGAAGASGAPVASTSAAALAYDQVSQVPTELATSRSSRATLTRRPAARPCPGRPAADRAARQGRAARLRRELRPGRRSGLAVLAGRRRGARRRHPAAGARPASAPAAPSSPRRRSAGISWLAHSTLQSGLWVDSQQRYDALVDQPPAHAEPARSGGPAGAPSSTCRPTPTTGRRASASTATTSSTTPATSGTPGPRFGYPTMPDQYTLDAFRRLELAPARPAAGDGRDRPGLQPRARGRRCRAWSAWAATSATARCTTACPSTATVGERRLARPRAGARRPTGSRSSTP